MKKAQLVSFDLLFSIIVLMLGLGLLVQFNETRIYSQKEELAQKELEAIGRTAAMLLVSNPEIACELEKQGGPNKIIAYLENCADHTNNTYSKIKTENLGIPNGYAFMVSDASGRLAGAPAIPDAAKNVFAETRRIATQNGKLRKAELEACMDEDASTTCPLVEKEVTIAVWGKTT